MNPFTPVIALVENDVPTNRAFTRLLRAHGYTVEAFTSAEMLLSRTTPAELGCILLDIDLDGMSGLELQQQLRSGQVAVPIIFITGRDDPGARIEAHARGCSGFLHKPVKAHVLVEAIEAAIANKH
jgi:FixJ family two-component response regulator